MNLKCLRKILPGLFIFAYGGFANGLDWEVGYEPFLIKQLNPRNKVGYQSGFTTSGPNRYQDEINLLFHLLSLRVKNHWSLPYKNLSLGIEMGLSASVFPVRKKWNIPPLDSSFTGIMVMPDSPTTSDDYWRDHNLAPPVLNRGIGRYMLEETSLVRIPFLVGLKKRFYGNDKIGIDIGLTTGLSCFILSMERKKLDSYGSFPTTDSFSTKSGSVTHIARTVGGDFVVDYKLGSNAFAFINFDVNGVKNLSNVHKEPGSDLIDGYRFDGLRYNYKLGVSWKL